MTLAPPRSVLGVPLRRCNCRGALLLLGVATLALADTCLPSGLPPASRRNVEVDGFSFPLGIVLLTWPSAELTARVAAILIQEVLGTNIEIAATAGGADEGLLKLAGCERTEGTVQCPPGPFPRDYPYHMAIEIWENTLASRPSIEAQNPLRLPRQVSLHYSGKEDMVVSRMVHTAARSQRGMHMDNYAYYDGAWNAPWDYFAKYTDISESRLKPCNETRLGSRAQIERFLEFAPDYAGIDSNGLAHCPGGYWWFSPACRTNTSRCIPVATGGEGWFVIAILQRAVEYNMPLAVTTAATWGDYVALPQEHLMMAYSWSPANHYLALEPLPILFPLTTDRSVQDRGDIRTAAIESWLTVNVLPDLETLAPTVFQLLSSLQVKLDDLTWMFQAMSGGLDAQGAACEWLQNHSKWTSWIPQVTDCAEGRGLVGAEGQFVASRDAATACGPCSAGRFSEAVTDSLGGTRVCKQCQAGSAQPMWGMNRCELCRAGHYQDGTGQSECRRCHRGSYAAGLGFAACEPCPPGTTTDGTGFASPQDCKCPEGTFGKAGDSCTACGEGLRCPGAGAEPEALPGYQLQAASAGHTSVFRCFGDPDRCPGGAVGSCAAGRIGYACAECESGKVEATDGTCVDCSGANGALAFVLCAVGAVLLVLLYAVSIKERRLPPSGWVATVLFMAAQLLSLGQLAGMLTRIAVDWPHPMNKVLDFMYMLFFSLDRLFSTNCLAPLSAASMYRLKVLALPTSAAALLLLHALWSVCRRRSPSQNLAGVFGAIGVLTMSLYITIALLILAPFQCRQHPNDKWTVAQYESVTCWEGSEHVGMMVLAVLALSLPLGFLSLVAWVLYRFPAKVRQGDRQWLRVFAFVLVRAKPDCRWFVWFILLRNLLIAMIPSVPNSFWQIFLMLGALFATGSLVAHLKPWRSSLVNAVDFLSMAGFQVLLLIAIPYAEDEVLGLAEAALVLFVGIFAVFPVYFTWVLFRRILIKKAKSIRFFVSHHKGSAGALARLVKMCLAERWTESRIFLDSDNLSDLQKLLGYVQHDTQEVLLLCSPPVLRSPWCIAELTTAFLSSVPCFCLQLPGFSLPCERFLQRLDELPLVEHFQGSFTVEDAKSALRALASKPFQRLARNWGERDLAQALGTVARDTSTTGWMHAELSKRTNAALGMLKSTSVSQSGQASVPIRESIQSGQPVVLADGDCCEAMAAGMVLVKLLREPLIGLSPKNIPGLLELSDLCGSEASLGGPETLVVLLCTPHCLSSPAFLLGLAQLGGQGLQRCLPITVGDGFVFPTPTLYRRLEERLLNDVGPQNGGPGLAGAVEALKTVVGAIFEKICLPLSIHGSSHMLVAQARQVAAAMSCGERTSLGREIPGVEQRGALQALRGLLAERLGGTATTATPSCRSGRSEAQPSLEVGIAFSETVVSAHL